MTTTRKELKAENTELRARLAATGNPDGRQRLRERLAEARDALNDAQKVADSLKAKVEALEATLKAKEAIAA